MSARVFLELLLLEYRANHLYTIANLLQWTLDALIREGDTTAALGAAERARNFLLEEMRRHPETVNSYTRDLAVMNAVKKMIEGEQA